MKGVIHWWANNHVAANLLMLTIFITGIVGYFKMEREFFPTFPYPGMQINVVWPGASPQDVEEQIVTRIEEAIKDVEDINYIQSNSRESNGNVQVFAEGSDNFEGLQAEIKNRIDSIVGFPGDMELPAVQQFATEHEVVRVAVHGNIGEKALKHLAQSLQREMLSLQGVTKVDLFGIRNEEVSIEISELSLRRHAITFDEIAQAIRNSSINLSAGTLETTAGNYSLRAKNLANSDKQFGNIIVKQLANGAYLKLNDIATINDGFEENEILATLNGEPAVLLQVMSTQNMDIIETSKSVKEWVESRQNNLPLGASLIIWTDLADDFKSRMNTISSAALSGLILVFIVLLLTLRPMIALWVSVGIATAFAGAFIFLDYLGTSLNMLSTFAFLLVLGVVVDDAIIVGESIHSEFSNENRGIAGATQGAQKVFLPVIFGVSTTIIAFLPWLFISGPVQAFTKQIAWVVILALVFSIIEAMWILPAHLSTLKHKAKRSKLGELQHKISQSIINFSHDKYGPFLRKTLARPGLINAIFFGAIIIGFAGLLGAGHIKTSFEPEVESEQIFVNIDLRDGTSFQRALAILAQMQEAQRQLVKEVEAENPEGKIVENWYTRSRKDSVIAIVKLAPPEIRTLSAKEAALKLRKLIGDIPEAKTFTVAYSFGGSPADLQFSIRHQNLDVLQLAVEDFTQQLKQYPAVSYISTSIESAKEEALFELKPQAEKLQLSLASVMRQVRQSFHGEEVQRLPRDGNDVKVMLRYPKSLRTSLESLNQLRIRTEDGREIPLESVVDITFAPGFKQIDRRDGKRSIEIRGYLNESVRDDILEDLKDNYIPNWKQRYFGVESSLTGGAEEQEEFMQEIFTLVLLALFAMFAILAVAFKSYAQPILILIAIPFAALGAFIGHLINNMPVGLYSYFGIVAASGIVINDNLVLIDAYNRFKRSGKDRVEAIYTAAVSRFRPILVTSLTTFIGLIPMMLERSTQAAFLQPIVVSLTYGVVMAFFVTLFLVPSLIIVGAKIAQLRNSKYFTLHSSTESI